MQHIEGHCNDIIYPHAVIKSISVWVVHPAGLGRMMTSRYIHNSSQVTTVRAQT